MSWLLWLPLVLVLGLRWCGFVGDSNLAIDDLQILLYKVLPQLRVSQFSGKKLDKRTMRCDGSQVR